MNDGPADPISELVSEILAARRGGRLVDPDRPGLSLAGADAAYRIQADVARQIGPVGGFKVANKANAPRIMAPIFAEDILNAPATVIVPRDEPIGIELEVGFRVDAPLPAKDASGRRDALAVCLSGVAVIEIVRTRLQAGAPPLLKLADNQINGGLVVGAPVRDWQALPMGELQAYLRLGADTVLDGPARVPGGDAFENFLVLEDMVGNHCGGLQPGHIVITGSLNGLPYVEGETEVLGKIEGLGEVSLRLEVLS